MVVIERAFLWLLAIVFAAPVGAGIVVAAALRDPALGAGLSEGAFAALADLAAGLPPEMLPVMAAGIARGLLALFVLPPVVIGLAGELFASGRLAWYAGGCALLTASVPWLSLAAEGADRAAGAALEGGPVLVLLLAGACSGSVAWLVAGRSVGRDATSTVTTPSR